MAMVCSVGPFLHPYLLLGSVLRSTLQASACLETAVLSGPGQEQEARPWFPQLYFQYFLSSYYVPGTIWDPANSTAFVEPSFCGELDDMISK